MSSSSASTSEKRLALSGIKVVEFAGLAPGPLVGMILADFGADVVRIDRVGTSLNPDSLCRGKRSLAISPKHPKGHLALRKLLSEADVVIDPFRPGVLERLGLGPEEVAKGNSKNGIKASDKCIFARITGFQRQGPYANMAGHDINYIALSGLLSFVGGAGGPPQPPMNLLADFAGGSLICVLGILVALVERASSGKGQVVEADMVTGSRYMATFVFLSSYLEHPSWGPVINDGKNESRGRNTLDGGAPWYGVYKTSDEGWMSVGAIEPQFYDELLRLLNQHAPSQQAPSKSTQHDRSTWPALKRYFEQTFSQKTKAEWSAIFVGTDACCVPVLDRDESAAQGVLPAATQDDVQGGDVIVPTPAPRLTRTPAKLPGGSPGQNEAVELLLTPGDHTNEVLQQWSSISDAELADLWKSKAVDGPESFSPEGSKL